MSNEITIIEGTQAIVATKRMNYEITVPGRPPIELKRGVDFDKVGKAKSVSLLKPGAERIIAAYGLMQRYQVESKIEQTDPEPFFFYSIKCDLVKLNMQNGQEYVFTSGYGSANTRERRNGLNDAYDAANATLKMACKRAMVAAAINIAGLSGAFSQDIEDETFITKNFEEIKATSDDEAPITTKQIKRLYAIGNEAGRNVEGIKQLLASKGYTSSKDIKQKDYDAVCKIVAEANNGSTEGEKKA